MAKDGEAMMILDYFRSNSSTLIEASVLVIASAITSVSAFFFLQLAAEGLKRHFDLQRAAKKSYRYLQSQKDSKVRGYQKLGVYQYLDYLIQSTTKGTEKTTHRFLVLLLTIFFSNFIFLQVVSSYSSSIGTFSGFVTGILFRISVSFIIMSLPVLWYVLKLRLIRIQSGYDLAAVTGIFLSKYRKQNKNVYEALLEVINNCKNVYIRRRILRIVKASQTFVDLDDLRREVDIFVFSINTTFARQMGVAILKGFSRSVDIEKSLEAIDKGLQLNIQMLSDEASQNQDVMQLGWIHLALFPLSIWAVLRFQSFAHYWQFQFETNEGRLWFFLSVISVLGSVFVALWFRKPPNDV